MVVRLRPSMTMGAPLLSPSIPLIYCRVYITASQKASDQKLNTIRKWCMLFLQ